MMQIFPYSYIISISISTSCTFKSCKGWLTNFFDSEYEEEASPPPENYYARNDYRDDDYSPSPPHASGGSYYPETNQFAPPPTAPAGFTQHPNDGINHMNDAPIPPYNPQDYAGQHPAAPVHDPYGYPPGTGNNVSANEPSRQNPPAAGAPYFPPPPTAPDVEPHHPTERNEPEGASSS
jgi:hypothetical protein